MHQEAPEDRSGPDGQGAEDEAGDNRGNSFSLRFSPVNDSGGDGLGHDCQERSQALQEPELHVAAENKFKSQVVNQISQFPENKSTGSPGGQGGEGILSREFRVQRGQVEYGEKDGDGQEKKLQTEAPVTQANSVIFQIVSDKEFNENNRNHGPEQEGDCALIDLAESQGLVPVGEFASEMGEKKIMVTLVKVDYHQDDRA